MHFEFTYFSFFLTHSGGIETMNTIIRNARNNTQTAVTLTSEITNALHNRLLYELDVSYAASTYIFRSDR